MFISYRRLDGDFVHRLTEKLEVRLDADIFIDLKIDQAEWSRALEAHIRNCAVFALVVTENTLAADRLNQPDDWVRREIALALALHKPIALAVRNNLEPLKTIARLPPDINGLSRMQAKVIHSNSSAAYESSVDEFAAHCVAISGGVFWQKPKTAAARTQNTHSAQAGDGSTILQGVVVNGSILTINQQGSKQG